MLTKFRKGFLVGALIILFGVTFSFAMTSVDTQGKTDKDQGKQGSTPPKVETKSAPFRVINIVLVKIDDEFVYAQDGRKFQRSPGTRIIKNLGSSKMRIAELFFHGDTLLRVVIK